MEKSKVSGEKCGRGSLRTLCESPVDDVSIVHGSSFLAGCFEVFSRLIKIARAAVKLTQSCVEEMIVSQSRDLLHFVEFINGGLRVGDFGQHDRSVEQVDRRALHGKHRVVKLENGGPIGFRVARRRATGQALRGFFAATKRR
jgi:hypothetical protein